MLGRWPCESVFQMIRMRSSHIPMLMAMLTTKATAMFRRMPPHQSTCGASRLQASITQ